MYFALFVIYINSILYGQLLQFSFMLFKIGLDSVSGCVCFIGDEFYLLLTWVGQELMFSSKLS